MKAVQQAEDELVWRNTAPAEADRRFLEALASARSTTLAGAKRLREIEAEIEVAVARVAALDTPVGAREFHRFLIGKMQEIKQVVSSASLDDTSKKTLVQALVDEYKVR